MAQCQLLPSTKRGLFNFHKNTGSFYICLKSPRAQVCSGGKVSEIGRIEAEMSSQNETEENSVGEVNGSRGRRKGFTC